MRSTEDRPIPLGAPVHHALTSSRPRIRYRVGKHAKLLATLPRILPERLMDGILHRVLGNAEAPETGRKESETQKAARPVSPSLNPK